MKDKFDELLDQFPLYRDNNKVMPYNITKKLIGELEYITPLDAIENDNLSLIIFH